MRFLTSLSFFLGFIPVVYAQNTPLVFSDEEIGAFDTEKTLSENLKEEKEKSSGDVNDRTWLDELTKKREKLLEGLPDKDDTPQLQSGDSLREIVKNKKATSSIKVGSNASVFDISGVMLRMSVIQAEAALKKRGYDKISQGMQIPNFIKWRNEEKCRNSGVYGYERLANCVTKLSKTQGAEFIEVAKYKNKKTTEEIEIYMTSNFTKNKIYRILYSTEVPSIKGNSNKALYLRKVKIYEFWRKISEKYGPPDDETEVTWGMGEGKPFLKAKTGFLLLEDSMLQELDWTRMSREDQKFLNTNLYNF
ncbi:MAG: hypothetical protein R3Y43_07325 [Alphaproteobacteria bacterium]